MTGANLAQALRTCTSGIYAAEAAVGMLIVHGAWLDRPDFRQFIHAEPEAGMAAIDWPAVTAALAEGRMPSSNGEQKMLRLSASIAGHAPVILGDTITGLDDRNIQILVAAILHASGQRKFPSAP